jgi:hypothetical protein
MTERKITRNLVYIIIVLVIVFAVFMPFVLASTELDTRQQAAHLKVAIRATSAQSDTVEATLAPTSTAEAAISGAEPVEVVITVKGEETEQPEPESPASPEWETSWNDGRATLTLVVLNEGDVPVQPCFTIPAVYDREAVPVNIWGVEVLTGIGAKPSGTPDPALTSLVDNICRTGIRGQPAVHYDYSATGNEIRPGRSTTYTIVLHGGNRAGLPYQGQVNLYIPGAPPNEDEKSPRLTPFASLPFTVQSRPYESYAGSWQSLRDWGLPVLTSLVELLAAVLVAGVLLAYGLPLIGKQLGDPGLVMDSIKTKEGDEKNAEGERLRSLLEDEIDRFRYPGMDRAFSPTLVTGSTGTTKFTLPSKLNEQAVFGVIASILEYVFRPNTLKVTGQIQTSSVKGMGITLKLTDNRSGDIIGTESFWEVDYVGLKRLLPGTTEKPSDPLTLLVQAAAVWVCYKASDFVGKPYQPMGTTSWHSTADTVCALYMFGLITQRNAPADAPARALDLFHTALSHDRENPVAGINYARLKFESAMGQKRTREDMYQIYTLSRGRFEKVLDTLESAIMRRKTEIKDADETILDEELWLYQAYFNLAVVASLQAKTGGGQSKVERFFALRTLLRLASRLAAKAEALPGREAVTDGGLAVEKPSALDRIHAREGLLRDERHASLLRSMRQAIVALLGLMAMDLADPECKPDPDFAKRVAGSRGSLADINYRVHYDIACYYSLGATNPGLQGEEKEECYRKGFFYLEQALELPGDLKNFARIDDDLKNLSDKDSKRFNQIVNRNTETESAPVSEPANLAAVLAILSELADVDTPAELILVGKTSANRRDLSQKSDGKLSYTDITKWVHIAELMQLPGVDEIYATLLYRMGVTSLQKLKSRNPEALYRSMMEFNKKNSIVERVPSVETISRWIRRAAKMNP